jgi:SsrA-binding protein
MATRAPAKAKGNPLSGTIAVNRRARHDYDVLSRVEAGIALTGSEVKSAREHHVQLQGAYVRIRDGEAWLVDAHIAPYGNAGYSQHEARRDRKLLLHRREIARLQEAAAQQGLTLIPLAMYFKDGRVKVEVGVARGRKRYDKRQAIAERESAIAVARAVRRGA